MQRLGMSGDHSKTQPKVMSLLWKRPTPLEAATVQFWHVSLAYNGRRGSSSGVMTTEAALALLRDMMSHAPTHSRLRVRAETLRERIIKRI